MLGYPDNFENLILNPYKVLQVARGGLNPPLIQHSDWPKQFVGSLKRMFVKQLQPVELIHLYQADLSLQKPVELLYEP